MYADLDPQPIVNVRRRQARSAETRERIIEAAIHEFAHGGFDGATTRSIAQRAQVKHALIIYHFETKAGLWQAAVRSVIGTFEKTFLARMAGLRGVDDVIKLRLLQIDFIHFAAERPELHWLMSHDAGDNGSRIDWVVENLLRPNFHIWEELITSAQRSGRYIQGDPMHLHYLFLGAAVRVFMTSREVEIVLGRSPFDPVFVEEHIRLVQAMFYRNDPAPASVT